jgi:hypothetical protein
MGVTDALKLRRQQKEAQAFQSPTLEEEGFGTPTKLRLREVIETALSWMTRVEPSKRRILQSMVPQVIRMVGQEDPERVDRFVRKTASLAVYVLEGPGASLLIHAEEMRRADADQGAEDVSKEAPADASIDGDDGSAGVAPEILALIEESNA